MTNVSVKFTAEGAEKLQASIDSVKSKLGLLESNVKTMDASMKATAGPSGGVTILGIALGTMLADAIQSAVGGIKSFATESVNLGGQFESISDSFSSMTQNMGFSSEELVSSIQSATGNTISELDILKGGTRALSLIGEDAFTDFGSQFEQMSVLAKKAARATGQDVDYLFESVILGVGRSSPLILDNLGLQIKLSEAYDKYAEQLGVASSELTQTQQKQALLNEVLSQGEDIYGHVAVSAGGVAGAIARVRIATADLQKDFGLFLSAYLVPIFNFIEDSVIPGVRNFASGIGEISSYIKIAISDFMELFSALGGMDVVNGLLAIVIATVKNAIELFNALISPLKAFFETEVGAKVLSTAVGALAVSFGVLGSIALGKAGIIAIYSAMQILVGTKMIAGVMAFAGSIKALGIAFIALGKIMLAHPAILFGTLLIAGIVLIYKYRDEVMHIFSNLRDYLGNIFVGVVNKIVDALNWLINGWNKMASKFGMGIIAPIESMREFGDEIEKTAEKIDGVTVSIERGTPKWASAVENMIDGASDANSEIADLHRSIEAMYYTIGNQAIEDTDLLISYEEQVKKVRELTEATQDQAKMQEMSYEDRRIAILSLAKEEEVLRQKTAEINSRALEEMDLMNDAIVKMGSKNLETQKEGYEEFQGSIESANSLISFSSDAMTDEVKTAFQSTVNSANEMADSVEARVSRISDINIKPIQIYIEPTGLEEFERRVRGVMGSFMGSSVGINVNPNIQRPVTQQQASGSEGFFSRLLKN